MVAAGSLRLFGLTTISVGQYEVHDGQEVDVIVSVDCLDDLAYFSLRILFDPSLVEVVYDDQVPGGLSELNGVTWSDRADGSFYHSLTDVDGGRVLRCTVDGSWLGVTAVTEGSGELYRFTFRGLSEGTTVFDYPDLDTDPPKKLDGTDDTVSTDEGTAQVTVYGPPSAVVFDPLGGTYSDVQTVALSSQYSTAIYYTLNGTAPDEAATQYVEELQVDGAHDESVTVKAIAYNDYDENSGVSSAVYTFDKEAPTATLSWFSPSVMTVTFSEAVTGAATPANYTFSPALEVTSIAQNGDEHRLTTSTQAPATMYTLTSFGSIADAVGHGVDNTPQVQSGDFFVLDVTDGVDTTRLAFGELDSATDGFDEDIDILLGARSAARGFTVHLRNPTVSTSSDPSEMLSDLRATGAATTRWRLVVDVDTSRTPVDLTWDVSAASADREVYLQPVLSERLSSVPVDLKQSSEPLTISEDSEFALVYSALRSPSFSLTFSAGWNLTGFPVMSLQSAASVLVDAGGQSLYVEDLLYWDGSVLTQADAGYPLRAEWGVWIYSPSGGETQPVDGVDADGAVLLVSGWNVVTPVSGFEMASDTRLWGRVWVWEADLQAYRRLRSDESLVPGKAYAVYVEGEGFLLDMGQ